MRKGEGDRIYKMLRTCDGHGLRVPAEELCDVLAQKLPHRARPHVVLGNR